MTTEYLGSITVLNKQYQPMLLTDLLNEQLNVLHFQDSYGSGRTCNCVLSSIEVNLERLSNYGSTTLIVADDAFDKENPPETKVHRVVMTKAEMGSLNLLDEEGYVCRTTLIVNSTGAVLATLPVMTEEELGTHIEQAVLPTLIQLQRKFIPTIK
ncbi:MAG: hypothetical protein JGK17_11145 [Microcoleus sp. PH2017_10_PVI_O_A]|uniref:hypothetical protein n=1 Tax=unclassified Microcoleus TaxID=2642155 RepID=UPI001DA03B80|nr:MULTISPECIES: hypothetical protein [unclassified Microcoleus]TAE82908.1 MAG: hypothetical protein EAZ83_10875 [Oscillatoriales cyanobacterium]MCC3406127.1 hypothetical protein [Microcoleus sp. PH2017_10_PVI_O_A]MCC3460535.1 hypothetical protein [Microcoleus sp. PH2017_11_PCY_U_A]MCC3479028.1 hypothetical protein [Microcoleus sp. PH2017_12_PCY_D_A]MCC3529423.1 hypothetical protein [Microcoleus sp. PH2017_21_RUC_O_A]